MTSSARSGSVASRARKQVPDRSTLRNSGTFNALHVALCLAALVGTLWVSRGLLPDPVTPVQLKLAHLEQTTDSYSAVFFGSSRVFREIVPSTFEKEMAKRGLQERAFNFGISGMKLPSTLHALEQFMATGPSGLRWVFVELSEFTTEVDRNNTLAAQVVAWHNADAMARLLKGIAAGSEPWNERAQRLLAHGRLFLRNIGLAGRARPLVPGLELATGPGTDPMDASFLQANQQGWLALEAETHPSFLARRARFLDNPQRFQDLVEGLAEEQNSPQADAHDPLAQRLSPYQRLCVERVLDIMQGHEARLVFVILPTMRNETPFKQAHLDGLFPDLLSFNELEHFAEFYEADKRFDNHHLARPAARRLTRLLAGQVAEMMEQPSAGASKR